MGKSIQSFREIEGLLGPDRLSEALRGRVREVILKLAEAELAEVLAARRAMASDGVSSRQAGKMGQHAIGSDDDRVAPGTAGRGRAGEGRAK